MVVLLVLFPIVMLEMRFLNPWLASLHPSPATFIGNALSVALLTFPLMPIALWALDPWLALSPGQKQKNFFGYLFMAFLYILEVAFFWFVF
jgi:antibiotic biosynthesis monooxygenase (ABM) superfamily enzyme